MPGCDNDDDSTCDHQGYEAAPADKDDYDVPQLLRTSHTHTHTHTQAHAHRNAASVWRCLCARLWLICIYLFIFTFSTQSRFYFVLVRPANYAGLGYSIRRNKKVSNNSRL